MPNPIDAIDWERLNERLGVYRPATDRLIFGLALLGAVVVAHLGIQQARGFEEGCVGVAAFEPGGAGFDCAAVVASGASTLLGVSNVVWGVLFYGAVAALSYAALALPAWRLRVKQVRAGLIGVGFLYSSYLVYYQAVQLDAFCALCLVSAGIVAALVVLLGVSLFSSDSASEVTMSTRAVKREFTLLTYFVALTGLVIAADVMYMGGRNANAASSQLASAASTQEAMQVADGCSYDPEKSPVEDFASLVDFQDPMKGNADAPVTIIEYFDPNCPHCKTMHTVMEEAVEEYGDEARFVFKPMPLWEYSIPQIEALYAAAQEDKFFDMLEAQYERQQQGGLSMEQLRAIAREIGMDPDVLAARLDQQTYRDRVLQQRQQAINIGVNSTPTIIINGRFVDGQSRTLECFGEFVEAATQDAAETSG